ncbi:MAG: histidine kinase [Bacteroidota bacterium]
MSLRKKLIISGVLLLVLLTLRLVFFDAQNEFPTTLNLLIGGTICFGLFSYLHHSQKLQLVYKWSLAKIIGYIVIIALLVVALQYTSRIHDHDLSDSIWIDDHGNAWIKDVIGSVLAIVIFYLIFSVIFGHFSRIQELKTEKSNAQLALLKNQINPHFFFNTLNTLYAMIKKDPDEAQDYVLKLSEMMRFTIDNGQNEMVTLESEIQYLENFIALQTRRYHRDIDISFSHSVQNAKQIVGPLLFITLVENAFKHGVEALSENSKVTINLDETENEILFSVENNFDEGANVSGTGIGLMNLKERLQLMYPNRHQLSIESSKNVHFASIRIQKI